MVSFLKIYSQLSLCCVFLRWLERTLLTRRSVLFGKDGRSCSEKTVDLVRKRRSVFFGKDDQSYSDKTIGLVRKSRSVLFGKDSRSFSEKMISLVRIRRSVLFGKDGRSCSRKTKSSVHTSHCIYCGWECKMRSHDYFGLISLFYSQFSELRSHGAVKKKTRSCPWIQKSFTNC